MPDFLLVCTKFNFGWDSARDLAERAYSAPQTPSVMVKELAALPLPKTLPPRPFGSRLWSEPYHFWKRSGARARNMCNNIAKCNGWFSK